jgi:hypothetical protein
VEDSEFPLEPIQPEFSAKPIPPEKCQSFSTKCRKGSNIVAEWSTNGQIPAEIDSLIAYACNLHFDLRFKKSDDIYPLLDIIEAAYRFGFDEGQKI